MFIFSNDKKLKLKKKTTKKKKTKRGLYVNTVIKQRPVPKEAVVLALVG